MLAELVLKFVRELQYEILPIVKTKKWLE